MNRLGDIRYQMSDEREAIGSCLCGKVKIYTKNMTGEEVFTLISFREN